MTPPSVYGEGNRGRGSTPTATPLQPRLFPGCPRPGPLQTPPRASLPPRPRAGLQSRLQAMVALDDPDGGLEATPGAETRL